MQQKFQLVLLRLIYFKLFIMTMIVCGDVVCSSGAEHYIHLQSQIVNQAAFWLW